VRAGCGSVDRIGGEPWGSDAARKVRAGCGSVDRIGKALFTP
jgi:hypothetical protein